MAAVNSALVNCATTQREAGDGMPMLAYTSFSPVVI